MKEVNSQSNISIAKFIEGSSIYIYGGYAFNPLGYGDYYENNSYELGFVSLRGRDNQVRCLDPNVAGNLTILRLDVDTLFKIVKTDN